MITEALGPEEATLRRVLGYEAIQRAGAWYGTSTEVRRVVKRSGNNHIIRTIDGNTRWNNLKTSNHVPHPLRLARWRRGVVDRHCNTNRVGRVPCPIIRLTIEIMTAVRQNRSIARCAVRGRCGCAQRG